MTGIFFGSTTGNTEGLADMIAKEMGVDGADVHNVAGTPAETAEKYDLLLLGSSTWGYGELQDDWEGFLSQLKVRNLNGKKVAFFGTGDHESYPDTFCDSLGIIKEALEGSGCTFVGAYDAAGYEVSDSRAFEDGMAIGLAADEDNEPDKTPARMKAWVESINKG